MKTLCKLPLWTALVFVITFVIIYDWVTEHHKAVKKKD